MRRTETYLVTFEVEVKYSGIRILTRAKLSKLATIIANSKGIIEQA